MENSELFSHKNMIFAFHNNIVKKYLEAINYYILEYSGDVLPIEVGETINKYCLKSLFLVNQLIEKESLLNGDM